jgi:hypothetical protein
MKDLMSDKQLEECREITRLLTDDGWAKHSPGQLVVRQFSQLSQGQFVYNAANDKVLWEACWGNGPATEALCKAPQALRNLLDEVDILRVENERLANEIDDLLEANEEREEWKF